ncbi:MAG TPA: M48 family metallopeptidase, partial [Tepidisphaeraceae bacterium]|nr:M48 family metallopeptidase [Tepidisphaeraceae bacterium]
MSRILLLLPFILWLSWTPGQTWAPPIPRAQAVTIFLSGYVLIVLVAGLWSRLLARRLTSLNLDRSLARFSKTIFILRWIIPAWFGVGIYALTWGDFVDSHLPIQHWPIRLPSVLIGTAPAFIAWIGLWWAQFPADRALREQNLGAQLDEDLPTHAPPKFWSYLVANLRMQLLFILVPVLLIMLVRDVLSLMLWKVLPKTDFFDPNGPAEGWVMLSASAVIFIIAPAILTRVLHTQPLPDSPLRDRLHELCDTAGLRYRDILLWRTDSTVGNAAVMGVVPVLRYILLSDLLMETMSDKQIEAVFAHEIGHVKHHHLLWFVVLVAILMLAMMGPGTLAQNWIDPRLPKWFSHDLAELTFFLAAMGAFYLLFGFVSRRFEMQADVYAARMMERLRPIPTAPALAPEAPMRLVYDSDNNHVGEYGARLFGSALYRVAVINNIPISQWNFSHGSIAWRMESLR